MDPGLAFILHIGMYVHATHTPLPPHAHCIQHTALVQHSAQSSEEKGAAQSHTDTRTMKLKMDPQPRTTHVKSSSRSMSSLALHKRTRRYCISPVRRVREECLGRLTFHGLVRIRCLALPINDDLRLPFVSSAGAEQKGDGQRGGRHDEDDDEGPGLVDNRGALRCMRAESA